MQAILLCQCPKECMLAFPCRRNFQPMALFIGWGILMAGLLITWIVGLPTKRWGSYGFTIMFSEVQDSPCFVHTCIGDWTSDLERLAPVVMCTAIRRQL